MPVVCLVTRRSPGIASLLPRLSVPSALMEFLLLGEKVGVGVSRPGGDGAALLALGNSQTRAGWLAGWLDGWRKGQWLGVFLAVHLLGLA